MSIYCYIGYGAVTIPKNCGDRDSFVEGCLSWRKISIVDCATGNLYQNCYITEEALHNIEFPEKIGGLGSRVIFAMRNINNTPTIIGTILGDGLVSTEEEEGFSVQRSIGSTILSFVLSVKNKAINMICSAAEKALISIRAITSNNTGSIELFSDNTIVETAPSHNIFSNIEISRQVKNEDGEDEIIVEKISSTKYSLKVGDKMSIEISGNKITFNEGGLDGLVKLHELEDNLNSIKNYCEKLSSAISTGLNGVGSGSAASGSTGAGKFEGAMAGTSITIKDMENKAILQ